MMIRFSGLTTIRMGKFASEYLGVLSANLNATVGKGFDREAWSCVRLACPVLWELQLEQGVEVIFQEADRRSTDDVSFLFCYSLATRITSLDRIIEIVEEYEGFFNHQPLLYRNLVHALVETDRIEDANRVLVMSGLRPSTVCEEALRCLHCIKVWDEVGIDKGKEQFIVDGKLVTLEAGMDYEHRMTDYSVVQFVERICVNTPQLEVDMKVFYQLHMGKDIVSMVYIRDHHLVAPRHQKVVEAVCSAVLDY